MSCQRALALSIHIFLVVDWVHDQTTLKEVMGRIECRHG